MWKSEMCATTMGDLFIGNILCGMAYSLHMSALSRYSDGAGSLPSKVSGFFHQYSTVSGDQDPRVCLMSRSNNSQAGRFEKLPAATPFSLKDLPWSQMTRG